MMNALKLLLFLGSLSAYIIQSLAECFTDYGYNWDEYCKTVAESSEANRQYECSIDVVNEHCPRACGVCCKNNYWSFRFTDNNGNDRGCWWVAQSLDRVLEYCDMYVNGQTSGFGQVKDYCNEACGYCFSRLTVYPSTTPSQSPSPSVAPSSTPSSDPSSYPSLKPSLLPSTVPSKVPSDFPSKSPSSIPSLSPTISRFPSLSPSISFSPSASPSANPTKSAKVKKSKKSKTGKNSKIGKKKQNKIVSNIFLRYMHD